ncbi:MAG TPA: RraA family protein [Acidimicrobiales bacterium]|nr:RraA family protein [Acidimicrobiales bacterium]
MTETAPGGTAPGSTLGAPASAEVAGGIVGRLVALDTCAVSDALDRLGLPSGVAGIVALSVRRRIAGRAITVKLGPADDRGPASRHLCTAAIEAGGPGTVVVVEHPGGAGAGWGGILALSAVVRGIEGVVVDGPCRDLDEAVAVGFPVYGRSPTPVTARGRLVELDWNVPIVFGGLVVSPGDLVIADGSGVAFVGAGRAEEVVEAATSIAAREAEMAAAVRRGEPPSSAMGASYERLLQRAPAEDARGEP